MPPRSAWVEINLPRWRNNLALIRRELPPGLGWLSVIKDNAYGHDWLLAAQLAEESGAAMLGVSTVHEAVTLREAGVRTAILLFGERQIEDLPWCVAYDITCCLGDLALVPALSVLARKHGAPVSVHLKINTGMNRYGVPWTETAAAATCLANEPVLELRGVFSHFAQSDEADKTYAHQQLSRLTEALRPWAQAPRARPIRHLCNSGGFLDLPAAHLDLVRLGILPLGVYPSVACRRIPGLAPVMSVKARIATIRTLHPGDHVGYGMRYTARSRRRIAVLPLGYGDGFPRLCNEGAVLVHGQRAPIVGGVSMDALTVDVTDIPATQPADIATLMGADQQEEISAHALAKLKKSVSYDVLCGWRSRLPRIVAHDLP